MVITVTRQEIAKELAKAYDGVNGLYPVSPDILNEATQARVSSVRNMLGMSFSIGVYTLNSQEQIDREEEEWQRYLLCHQTREVFNF